MRDLSLSVLLLARDETRDLEELIPSLAFASEVVVVWDPRGDAGTRAAAERLGARVYEREFDGFGAQRQFALERCTGEWVLWIDADERLDAEAARRLTEGRVTGTPDGALPPLARRGVALTRVTTFLGARIRFCGWRGETVLRVFRREGARFDGALVHETLVFDDAPGGPGPAFATLGCGLVHHSYRTLEDCETKLRRYGEAGALKAYRAGRRANAFDAAVRPPLRFLRQYVLQLGVLDGAAGLRLCRYAARQVALKYALLARWTREGRSE